MENIKLLKGNISGKDREKLLGQKGVVVWITGLPASGKSSIAYGLEEKLYKIKRLSFVLDGDNLRHGLCRELGFTEIGRDENIRRAAEVAKLFVEAGIIIICAFISPKEIHREIVRDIVGKKRFIEVFVDCPINICQKRDPKGFYKKAKDGDIKNFTGISSNYEIPVKPDIRICSDKQNINLSVQEIFGFVLNYTKL